MGVDDTLRGAVVGVGAMGRHHARVISESDRTTLACVVDPAPEAERVATRHGAQCLRTLDELLAEPRLPDFAIVSVPTEAHGETAGTLIAAGIPVLVEKPIAGNVGDAIAIIDAAEAADVPLAVGHVERFNPAVRALQARLEEGVLGRVFQIHARRLSPFPARVGDAGVALDLATHDLDLMCELAGNPLRVAAEVDRKAHSSHEDLLAAVLRFDSGTVGLLEVNWLTPTKVRRLMVTGERGMLTVDYLNQHLTLHENAHLAGDWETLDIFTGVAEGNMTRFAIARAEPLREQLESFVSSIQEGQSPVASGNQGLRVLRLALACVSAGVRGETVALKPETGLAARVRGLR